MVCLENARDILQALEREYQKAYEKNLRGRVSEVISSHLPRQGQFPCAYHVTGASLYIENDIQRLLRLKNIAVYAGSDTGGRTKMPYLTTHRAGNEPAKMI